MVTAHSVWRVSVKLETMMMPFTLTIVVLWILALSMLLLPSPWAIFGFPVTLGLSVLLSFWLINFVPLIYCVIITAVVFLAWKILKRLFAR